MTVDPTGSVRMAAIVGTDVVGEGVAVGGGEDEADGVVVGVAVGAAVGSGVGLGEGEGEGVGVGGGSIDRSVAAVTYSR